MLQKETRLLKIGVLGCGQISQSAHFEACRRSRNAELYAICDVAEDLLGSMAAIHTPAKVYRDYDEMLADPQIEAIIVGIADQFHVAAAMKAIEAGKHVLVEKPLGVTLEECDELRTKVRASGLVLQVGNMKRFDPGFVFAKRFIKEEMGQILALKAWYCDSKYRYTVTENVQPIQVVSTRGIRPEGNPKQDKRRYTMLTHGSHLVDTARFLGGEIISIHARHVEKYGAHCWLATVEYANGAIGHLDLTVAVRMDWHEGFHVYGEQGSVIGKTYNPWLFKASDVEVFSVKDGGVYHRPLGEDAHFFKLQVEGFADSILHGAPMHGADIHDGMAAMRALVAMSKSVELGRSVRLDEVEGGV